MMNQYKSLKNEMNDSTHDQGVCKQHKSVGKSNPNTGKLPNPFEICICPSEMG